MGKKRIKTFQTSSQKSKGNLSKQVLWVKRGCILLLTAFVLAVSIPFVVEYFWETPEWLEETSAPFTPPGRVILHPRTISEGFGEKENGHTPEQIRDVEIHDNTMIWGTYRPHVCFGMRTRVPDGIISGLMWHGDTEGPRSLKHLVGQGNLKSCQWRRHDARFFGQVEAEDGQGTKLDISFVKMNSDHSTGGDWSVTVQSRGKSKEKAIWLYWYLENEWPKFGERRGVEFDTVGSEAMIRGSSESTGKYNLIMNNEKREKVHFHEYTEDDQIVSILGNVWNKQLNQERARNAQRHKTSIGSNWMVLPSKKMEKGQARGVVIQMKIMLPFSTTFTFVAQSAHADRFDGQNNELKDKRTARQIAMELKSESEGLRKSRAERFDDAFKAKFPKIFQARFTESNIIAAKTALSSVIGGIGYFYGSVNGQPPMALFSGVPSRSQFPRGFLWDEGFHQLLVGRWDQSISLEIISSWLSTMDSDGYIQREQLRGRETRKLFFDQLGDHGHHIERTSIRSGHANPPTLILALVEIIESPSLTADNKKVLANLLPLVKRHYKWLKRTQRAEDGRHFRWRGGDGNHTLPCGLDDYPRQLMKRKPNTPLRAYRKEWHVDLVAWIATEAKILGKLTAMFGHVQDSEKYVKEVEYLMTILDDHWVSKAESFCDFEGGVPTCHTGYVTILPFALRLVDPVTHSDRVAELIKTMQNTKRLFSESADKKHCFGLRSLSAAHPWYMYGKHNLEEKYWRGSIWININYLVLRALWTKYGVEGPLENQILARTLYESLRNCIVSNILSEYDRTHQFWENFDPLTGMGRGTSHFTGWTTLFVLMMAEQY